MDNSALYHKMSVEMQLNDFLLTTADQLHTVLCMK